MTAAPGPAAALSTRPSASQAGCRRVATGGPALGLGQQGSSRAHRGSNCGLTITRPVRMPSTKPRSPSTTRIGDPPVLSPAEIFAYMSPFPSCWPARLRSILEDLLFKDSTDTGLRDAESLTDFPQWQALPA